MRLTTPLAPAALGLAALLSTAAAAQDQPVRGQDRPAGQDRQMGQSQMDQGRQRYVALNELQGLEVRIEPTLEKVHETPTEKDMDRKTAKVKNLLLDPRTGSIEWAVLDTSGLSSLEQQAIAVPWSAMRRSPEKKGLELSANVEELKTLPAFDLAKAQREGGLAEAIVIAEASWSRTSSGMEGQAGRTGQEGQETGRQDQPREAGAERQQQQGRGQQAGDAVVLDSLTFFVIQEPLVAATEVAGRRTYARDEPFGNVSSSIVDLEQGRVAYLVLSPSQGASMQKVVVPYQATKMCTMGQPAVEGQPAAKGAPSASKEKVLCLEKSAQDMQTVGVPFEEGKPFDEEMARKVDQKFGSMSRPSKESSSGGR